MHYIGTLETLEIPNKRCKYTYFNGTHKKTHRFWPPRPLYRTSTHTKHDAHGHDDLRHRGRNCDCMAITSQNNVQKKVQKHGSKM